MYIQYFIYFCNMIELAKHIETLLLENDCVIVPGLGGFVAHYVPAQYVEEEKLFLPPVRLIGFNAKLQMNDGLLVQSYMGVYGTTFSDASKLVEHSVGEIFTQLHENGVVELNNVGKLSYSMEGDYSFTPYDNKIATPLLYGLSSFEMESLTTLRQRREEKQTRRSTSMLPKETKEIRFEIPINYTHLLNAAAMVAVIVFSFLISTPIQNTEVVRGNYAQMLPGELFEQIEKHSLAATPVSVSLQQTTQQQPSATGKRTTAPVTVKEVKVKKEVSTTNVMTTSKAESSTVAATKVSTTFQPKATTPKQASHVAQNVVKRYHIIVASLPSERAAQAEASSLISEGHSEAKVLVCGDKMRVSIASFASNDEASKAVTQLRQQAKYQGAWVFKK